VSAEKKYELKGRGGREAFVTEDTSGRIVLAAWSKAFHLRPVREGRTWDLTRSRARAAADDAEATSWPS